MVIFISCFCSILQLFFSSTAFPVVLQLISCEFLLSPPVLRSEKWEDLEFRFLHIL